MSGMFFDDVVVGQVFETRAETITKSAILDFATSFDPNPFHLNSDVAKCHGFADVIAPGMHTVSLSLKLFFDLKLWDDAVLPSPGIDNIRWHRPVLPGTRLFVRAKVTEVLPSKSRPDQGIIKIQQQTLELITGNLLLSAEVMHRLKRRAMQETVPQPRRTDSL